MNGRKSLSLALIMALISAGAAAEVVTFEEVVLPASGADVRVETSGQLSFSSMLCDPNCHSSGIPVLDISNIYGHINLSASGPLGGIVSDGLQISSVSGNRFAFESAYFGMTHPADSPVIQIAGYRGGQIVETSQLFPQQEAGKVFFHWSDLDAVKFSARIQTGYLTIDDIAVTVVPEPTSLILMLLGLAATVPTIQRRMRDASQETPSK